MRICIYGAGAVGGYLGAELARSGADVVLIARGAHLAAMRERGLKLIMEGEERVQKIACTDDPREVGPCDHVIVTLKAHSLPGALDAMLPLFGPETTLVTAQNGIPWWYFHACGGPFEGRRLDCVDPGGRIWDTIGPQRAIGCVVYPSADLVQPGVIANVSGKRFMLGEPDGSRSPRVIALGKALTGAGFRAPVRTAIRDDLWLKLWGNVSFNPVSVLTGATLEQLAGDPDTRAVIARMMEEARAVGQALGAGFEIDIDTRIGWAADVGAHKTSMLQDFELGRPLELDALVAVVCEMGRMVSVATPTIDAVLALVRLRTALRDGAAGKGAAPSQPTAVAPR